MVNQVKSQTCPIHAYLLSGKKLQLSETYLTPLIEVSWRVKYGCMVTSCQRGTHNIEHQITYPGSNFIFHDSQGFESGAAQELEVAWKFIKERSTRAELKDQLHAIWYLALVLCIGDWLASHRYCIPMDSPRPILATELEFFDKGTGNGESWDQLSNAIMFCWGKMPLCLYQFLFIKYTVYKFHTQAVLTSTLYIHSSIGGYIHQIWWSNHQGICWIEWYGEYR